LTFNNKNHPSFPNIVVLDELIFYHINVKKQDITYTTLSHIGTKEKIFLFAPVNHENFYVDQYGFVDSNLQHYGDINYDHNFKYLTFCLIETNNKPCINCCAKIYKFIKVFIYFNS